MPLFSGLLSFGVVVPVNVSSIGERDLFKNYSYLIRQCAKNTFQFSLVWFGLVWFYGISTIVDYLMLNPVHTYILNIYDL